MPLIFLAACNFKNDSIPFPADENGFTKPVAKKIAFSNPVSFQYITIDPDSIKPPKSIPFNLDKISSKPFGFNDFKKLQAPVQQTAFNLDALQDSVINLGETPAQPFRLQQFILPKPTKVKAGIPKLMPNTSTGVLQFSTEEGLPGINITASVIDTYDNTWLSTEKGLCMYDGEYLYIYSIVNKNAVGGDFAITGITTDKAGNIWIVTAGDGIYILNTTTNIVKRYASNIFYSDIICDSEGSIWISSFLDGLFIVYPAKEVIKNIRITKEKSVENSVITFTEDKYKNIWLGYFDHAAVIDGTRKHIKKITQAQGLISNSVIRFLEDSKGDMWVAVLGGGINVISLKDKTLSTINEKNGFNGMAAELAEDSHQQIWMMRKDTSYVLNKERTAIKQVLMDIKMVDQSFRGSCLMDRSGNIWLGTLGKGVVIIDTKGPLPQHLTTNQGLTNNTVWGIAEDKKGNIWLGTRQNINVYNPTTNQVKIIGTQQGLGSDRAARVVTGKDGNIFISTQAGLSIANDEKKTITNYSMGMELFSGISKCIEDTGGLVWISSNYYGILQLNTHTNQVKTIRKSTGLLSDVSWDMIKDRQGNLWLGSDSGITVLNPANNTVKHLREKDGLINNVVYKLLQHTDGEIWAGTLKGISVINTDNFTITNLTAKEGLVPQEIYDMVEQDGSIYAGSSDGLIVVKKTGNNQQWHFRNYGKREGFPYNDYNQNTGITTTTGQSWWGITPILTIVTQQPVADTLLPKINITAINVMDQSLSFATWASMGNNLKNNDTLWNENKTFFYLKNTLPKDSGYLATHNISWDSITPGFKLPIGLTLPYDQNSVNFSFNNNDIKGREKIMYRYVLEGADKTWSDITDKSSTKNYFNLSPGNYTFKVSTKGFNGLWSKVEEYHFSILPPWWKTWWAYILYAMASVFFVSAYTRYRSRQLIEKNVALENKINQRTSELSQSLEDLKATQSQLIQSEKMASLGELTAGIAHEIQNPLNFVNNFSEVSAELVNEMNDELNKGDIDEAKAIANDVKQNLEKISHHGKRAADIVKGMLQHSRSNSGVKEPVNINALADEYLRLAYHGLRAKDKTFNATLKTDFDETIGNINIIPQDIGRVILNLITNAFYVVGEKKKAGTENLPAGQAGFEPTVTVSTKKEADKILISVKDNGNGIPQKILDKIFQPFFTTKPTGQGTGLGLSLSYDIIKAHGGELKVETRENEGTTFIISIPIQQQV